MINFMYSGVVLIHTPILFPNLGTNRTLMKKSFVAGSRPATLPSVDFMQAVISSGSLGNFSGCVKHAKVLSFDREVRTLSTRSDFDP